MARHSMQSFYSGQHGALGRFGAVASASSDPAEVRARMQRMVDALRSEWGWIKTKIVAGDVLTSYFSAGFSTNTAGLVSTDNAISLKQKSMNDVLGGQTTLEKWLNGVEVLRAQILNYAAYVKDNASAMSNLKQLGTDIQQTAKDYAVEVGKIAAVAGYALGGTTIALVVFAGLLLWKLGPTLAAMYLPHPPRQMGRFTHKRRRRLSA